MDIKGKGIHLGKKYLIMNTSDEAGKHHFAIVAEFTKKHPDNVYIKVSTLFQ